MTGAQRVAVAIGLVLLGAVAVVGLAGATQNRPDSVEPGSASTVVFEVQGREFFGGTEPGVTLWAACQGSIESEALSVGQVDDETYRVDVQPALGENAERRLVGCLEDATVDRLAGHVVSIEAVDDAENVPMKPAAERVQFVP